MSGAVVEHYRYEAFGRPSVSDASGNGIARSAYGNRFMFTGREYLAHAGLYDFRNRTYSPRWGRFIEVDPIRFQGGDLNMYRYVGNGALNWVDLWGLRTEVIYWQGTGSGSGSFGHISIIINDESFSWGPPQIESEGIEFIADAYRLLSGETQGVMSKDTEEKYISSKKVDGYFIGLNLTPEEELYLMTYLMDMRDSGEMYNLTSMNCAQVISDALFTIGLDLSRAASPADFYDSVSASDRAIYQGKISPKGK